MSQVLLTREKNHPFVNGTLPFISTALGIYMVVSSLSKPLFPILFGIFAVSSFVAGIAFWRTRNLITLMGNDLIFRGFFSQFRLPAKSVKGIHTEAKMSGTYTLLVQTEHTRYKLSIPAPDGEEWAQLSKHLDSHDTFPYHLN